MRLSTHLRQVEAASQAEARRLASANMAPSSASLSGLGGDTLLNPPAAGQPEAPEQNATLFGVCVKSVLAEWALSTPTFFYDLDAIGQGTKRLIDAVQTPTAAGLCCYAVKANGAGPIVRRIILQGAGIDVVSVGELEIALRCGAKPRDIVWSGVAKRDDELDAAIANSIRAVHVESLEELARLAARARALGQVARVSLRINPGVLAETHAHIATGHDEAKFGITRDDLGMALDVLSSGADASALKLVGLSVHVGSQLLTPEPYLAGVEVLIAIAQGAQSRGFALEYLDTGGGFGIPYRTDEAAVEPAETVRQARLLLDQQGFSAMPMLIEPGRSLVGTHGVLITRVIQTKQSHAQGQTHRWVLIDAGMNDLMRPALYQAHHRIEPLHLPVDSQWPTVRVAGPVCESSDDFGLHPLPNPPPELLAIREAGAYGRSMGGTYNTRPRTAEVFVSAGKVVHVRRAPTLQATVMEELGE